MTRFTCWSGSLMLTMLLAVLVTQAYGQGRRQGHARVRAAAERRAERAESPKKVPEDLELLRDIPCGQGGNRRLTLNVLRKRSRSSKPAPAVVYIHGGGWKSGSKDSGKPLLPVLARRGFVCASIEYRLSGEAPFPAQIEDCKCAIRWLRTHAAEYGIDPQKIGVWGTSAGGHLAALLGTAGDCRQLEGSGGCGTTSSRVQAVVSSFGPMDLVARQNSTHGSKVLSKDDERTLTFRRGLLGGPPDQKKELARLASPITWVSPDDPPFLFIHGEQDTLVPIEQSRMMHAALQKAGVASLVIEIPRQGHGATSPAAERATMQFFERYLGTPP